MPPITWIKLERRGRSAGLNHLPHAGGTCLPACLSVESLGHCLPVHFTFAETCDRGLKAPHPPLATCVGGRSSLGTELWLAPGVGASPRTAYRAMTEALSGLVLLHFGCSPAAAGLFHIPRGSGRDHHAPCEQVALGRCYDTASHHLLRCVYLRRREKAITPASLPGTWVVLWQMIPEIADMI